ncbi:pilin N-terminal domain-containing protein [Enterococcus timonensis]|uniref:pilin N-terminal domain-containing protein n=1 Tax=Enterococcus timonensis TaxID=1852364 RepID=UPI0008D8D814|nr:pilin N-terminal domain-containing protein [Enterococcus timonensis]
MNFKKKAYQAAALSLLLAPMALGVVSGVQQVSAEVAVETVTVNLHKLQMENLPSSLVQNTGNIMGNNLFGTTAKPLGGVSFNIWDISAAYYDLRAELSVDEIKNVVQSGELTVDDEGDVRLYEASVGTATLVVNAGPTDINGLSTVDLPKEVDLVTGTDEGEGITVKRGAIYLILEDEDSLPANVITTAIPMLLALPAYEYNTATGKYTDKELDVIHLYPKNETGLGTVEIEKRLQAVAGEQATVAGAEFVIYRLNGTTKEYLTDPAANGNRSWVTSTNPSEDGTLAKMKTGENGKDSFSGIPRSSDEPTILYLEEVATGDILDGDIPEGNRSIPFTLNEENEYKASLTAANSIINNELGPIKTVEDVVNEFGEINYTVEFNVPIDIAYEDAEGYKYTDFFILDEHNPALSFIDEDSISFETVAYDPITNDRTASAITSTSLNQIPVVVSFDRGAAIQSMYQKIHNAPLTTDVTDNFLGVQFTNPAENLAHYAGATIAMSYTLVLSETTDVADVELLNTANIDTGYEKDKDSETVLTGGRKFKKVDVDSNETLSGAEFYVEDDGLVLYRIDGVNHWLPLAILELENGMPPEEVGHAVGGNAPVIYHLAKFVSDDNGLFQVEGLDYDEDADGEEVPYTTYTLQEFAAPSDRYILPDTGFDFPVYYGSFSNEDNLMDIDNIAKGSLPSTGGIGTLIFYLIGGLAMAGVVMVTKNKKKAA